MIPVIGCRSRVGLSTPVWSGSWELNQREFWFSRLEMRVGLTTPQRNILVDGDGTACISEYGLEIVLRDEAPYKPIPTNVRWMAPEVLSTKNRCIPSGGDGKAADVYSFAMIMFEVNLPALTREFKTASHPSPPGPVGYHPVPQRKR